MSATEFDELAAKLSVAASVVNAYQAEPVQLRVIDALIDAFHGGRHHRRSTADESNPGNDTGADARNGAPRRNRTGKSSADGEKSIPRRRSRGGTFTIVNDIDVDPDGKESLNDFLARVRPRNHRENCLAAMYWFEQIAQVTPVTDDMIFTVYRLSGWTLPKSLSNVLSQTGSADWTDPSDRKNLKVQVTGINLVEKTMANRPAKNKS